MPDPSIAATAEGIEAWLSEAVNHERLGDFTAIELTRIRAFLHHLPPPPAPCTVAGTKGKGSTTRLMECALQAAHIPTLAFTSPHLVNVLERWRRNGHPAGAEEVADACRQIARLEERHQVRLTYFERTFAVACLLAAAQPLGVFLCEVGLGGRLDCANALDCAVAVLTHLSHDHRDILGPTLHHIAREKLAVARPRRPLVIAPQSPAATLAIWRELGGRPWNGSRSTNVQQTFASGSGDDPLVHWVHRPKQPWTLALLGDHQQDNAATAATALRYLVPSIDDPAIDRGFAEARLAGRCQVVEYQGRRLLIDGAHNGPSMAATMQVAQRTLRAGWRLILGLARDKEVEEILASLPVQVYVTRCGYRSPRARQAGDWPAFAHSWRWFPDIGEAIATQPAHCDLCISGSLYLAGEALAHCGIAGAIPG